LSILRSARRRGRKARHVCALTFLRALPTIDRIVRPRPARPWVVAPSFMRILMIAPEPFFEPRGTPFSEYHRIRALLELGHTVDLVTYPFGQAVTLPGLRVFRCLRPPLLREVRIGPSLAKVPLDLALTVTAMRRALSDRYDAIHSHEEGAAIGIVLSALLGIPHIYDMHSSLPQQLSNFAYSRSRVLRWVFTRFERAAVRHSKVVIVICPELQRIVQEVQPDAAPILIENAPGAGDGPVAGPPAAVRAAFGVAPSTPLVVYTGTFEAYQGLDLLFAAAALVVRSRPDVRFLLAGGRPEQIASARAEAAAAGVGDAVIFTGELPAADIPGILEAADVLVSPRSRGTNTPLKIYQYLRSGRAIVATRLLTHTQVLDDTVAFLTGVSPRAFADGMLAALDDPATAAAVGARAAALAATKYSYDAYLERTREVVARVTSAPRPQVAGGIA
jgi:glycosyltransferase involved in cell wall biosynthesis